MSLRRARATGGYGQTGIVRVEVMGGEVRLVELSNASSGMPRFLALDRAKRNGRMDACLPTTAF